MRIRQGEFELAPRLLLLRRNDRRAVQSDPARTLELGLEREELEHWCLRTHDGDKVLPLHVAREFLVRRWNLHLEHKERSLRDILALKAVVSSHNGRLGVFNATSL